MSISIPWGSLKLRLALTAALLTGLSVAVTVVHAVREAQRRAEQSIVESNLGVGQIAAGLSAGVVERERALSAAARGWSGGDATAGAQAGEFLARQPVLRTLFDNLLLVDGGAVTEAAMRLPIVSSPSPSHEPASAGATDIVISVPIADRGAHGRRLAGTLSLLSANFLSVAGKGDTLGNAALRTIVADHRGRVLASSDPSTLLRQVDDDPRLLKTVARWRSEGAPLEPAPWTERVEGNFVAMAAVPGTDWMVFRVAPAEALFERASRSILRITATGVLAGLLGALAILAATTWFLRPMGRLRERALRALDPVQPADEGWPQDGGEIGQLSQVLRHVTEQLATSRIEMAQSLRQMQAVLDFAPAGIAFTIDGHFALVSREFERTLGYDRGQLDGGSWEMLLPQPAGPVRDHARAAFRDGDAAEPELQLRCRDGSLIWVWLQGAVVQGRASSGHRIWIVSDVTNARRQREQLQWSATHDPLTDLANRREFEDQLHRLLVDRRSQPAACALFIDLDHFKQVNDGAGHGAGDVLLRRVAQALRRRVREEDTVARLGGDEFAVLLRGCNLERALQVAEQIRAEVQLHGEVEGMALRVTASVGVVEVDGTHASLSAILEAADQACYAAKHAGRNIVRAACDRRPIALELRVA